MDYAVRDFSHFSIYLKDLIDNFEFIDWFIHDQLQSVFVICREVPSNCVVSTPNPKVKLTNLNLKIIDRF